MVGWLYYRNMAEDYDGPMMLGSRKAGSTARGRMQRRNDQGPDVVTKVCPQQLTQKYPLLIYQANQDYSQD